VCARDSLQLAHLLSAHFILLTYLLAHMLKILELVPIERVQRHDDGAIAQREAERQRPAQLPVDAREHHPHRARARLHARTTGPKLRGSQVHVCSFD
jgi:hypothetical protein